ncbi:glycoside hydrolase family 30 protein [Cryobacterium sp. W22_MBD10_FK3]|uniref:glycoside hydrolase family 30 protein n=1 Tax=Cryobacterium sp. W22_MBD10_FK3 TaxID=3240273 RepID=UPI003F900168
MNGPQLHLSRWERQWIIPGIAALLVGVVIVIISLAMVRDAPRTSSSPEPSASSPEPSAPTLDKATASTTTADRTELMQALPVEVDPSTDDDAPDVVINRDIEAQRVEGFGAAMTHASAELLSSMPDEERAALLDELFSTEGPVRLSTLRIPIGASDFVSTDAFTFDDLEAGATDWELERFSLDPDRSAMIPMLQEVVAINPAVRLIASPWSPPAWLKTSGSLEGGRLLDEDRAYDTYAAYLMRFIEGYGDAGINIDLLTVQNEPQLRYPDGYPATDMPVWQQAKFIERLGPELDSAGLDTGILGFDHNWELNPADAASAPQGEDPAYQYPADLLRTPAAAWIDGIAFHCYYGNASAQTRLWEQFPDIEIWLTECSGSNAPNESAEKAFADTFSWQSTNLLINSLRNRAAGVLTWNLALDETGGPHRGGCETCTGVVTIATDGTVTRNAEYYVLAQAARYLPAGSFGVESRSDTPDLQHVAFVTPEGSQVLLVWNASGQARTISVGDEDRTITAELPAASLSTIMLDGTHLVN